MPPIAIFTTSRSVSAHLKHVIIRGLAFKKQTPLQRFLTINPNAIVLLHYNAFPDTTSAIITSITKKFPDSSIVVICDHPTFTQGFAFLKQGIKGYANSYMGDLHYAQLLAMVSENRVWLYPEFLQQLIHHMLAPSPGTGTRLAERLTPREHEIASLICDTLSNQEIADQTGITVRTVKQHLSNIYEKLDIKDRLSLALLMKSEEV